MRGSEKPPRENIIYYELKTKLEEHSKEDAHPVFKCKSKDKDGKQLSNETELTGHLVDLRFKEIKYGHYSEKAELVEFELYDPQTDERYLISSWQNSLSRDFLNQLLNCPLPFDEPLRLSLYKKNDFANLSLNVNTEWPGVRFKWKEDIAPLITEVEFKGKKMKDYSAVDRLMQKEIKLLTIKAIKANAERFLKTTVEDAPKVEDPDPTEHDETDDLPF